MLRTLVGGRRSALTPTARERLKGLVLESTRLGEWKLFSGATSDIYVDAKETILIPEGVTLFARWVLEKIQEIEKEKNLVVSNVGGLEVSAVQITGSVVTLAEREYNRGDLRGFYVRKEKKEHGTRSLVEGAKWLTPKSNVVVVEDVVTTGKSVLLAIEAVEQRGSKVVGVLALVDRQENSDPKLSGYEVQSVFSLPELREAMKQREGSARGTSNPREVSEAAASGR